MLYEVITEGGVVVGALIVMSYTISGGFRAVAWTDVVQALLMIIAMMTLPLVLLVHLGGIDGMWQRLGSLEEATTLTAPFADQIGMALVGFMATWLVITSYSIHYTKLYERSSWR